MSNTRNNQAPSQPQLRRPNRPRTYGFIANNTPPAQNPPIGPVASPKPGQVS